MFKKQKKSEIILIFLILMIFLNLTSSNYMISAETGNDFPFQPNDTEIVNAINFLKNQQSEDGSIGGISVSAWAAMAISSVEEDPRTWRNLVNYLKEKSTLLDSEKATDWERQLLAIVASNENPRNFAEINFIEKIKDFYDGIQMGDSADLYDDFFGILSLVSAGVKKNDALIQELKSYIINNQDLNGGWGDADSTSAAIMALIIAGQKSDSKVIKDALTFLKTLQTNDGGFHSWGKTNLASTSWSIMAIVAVGENPTGSNWQKNGKNPVEYVLSLQQKDGGFNWAANQSRNPQWMTSYAIPALVGGYYPVKINESGIENNNPPDPPNKPTGPNIGQVGMSYTFSTSGIDYDGDRIQYRFDWDSRGNHDYSSWTSLDTSGHTNSINHLWDQIGTYLIEAQTRDEHGLKSSWSHGLEITINEDKKNEYNEIKKDFKIIKPEDKSMYFANIKIKNTSGKILAIGAIDIKLKTTNNTKKVEFYVNDELEYSDRNFPFEYKLNKRSFFIKINIVVKSFILGNISSDILYIYQKIMELLNKNEFSSIQEILTNFLNNYKAQNFIQKDIDNVEIIALNLFPNLHLR